MERTGILAAMSGLQLYCMRAAYDEIAATAVKRQHERQRLVGDLLEKISENRPVRSNSKSPSRS